MVVPNSESQRIEALHRCNILDTAPEDAFDELAILAAQICYTPIALITLVDADRQWFKSKLGLTVDEIPRESSFCAYTIQHHGLFAIRDALEDSRFVNNPLVAAEPKVRSYAGVPLITAEGFAVGTLCVMSPVPKLLSKDQTRALEILGRQVSRWIALRHRTARMGTGAAGWEVSSMPARAEVEHIGQANDDEATLTIDAPLKHLVDSRSYLLRRMAIGLLRDEFVVHFQPKIELASRHVTGFESLVRWMHPDLGLILPEEFIPVAEEAASHIESLTLCVLKQTLQRACACGWVERGLHVAINLSARSLQDGRLPGLIMGILETWNFPPRSLILEITESAFMSDFSRARATLNRLRDIGVSLSVDDYGTGYASLAYLKDLPLQELKIDRAFVTNIQRRERDLAIVRATVELAHKLGMTVIAEGVEDLATLETLQRIGCDGAQGYAIARPMRPEELIGWLATHS
jgi:EAL domain-containing protein (putative c-di-GMP-specific phosphodiesterase class I)